MSDVWWGKFTYNHYVLRETEMYISIIIQYLASFTAHFSNWDGCTFVVFMTCVKAQIPNRNGSLSYTVDIGFGVFPMDTLTRGSRLESQTFRLADDCSSS